MKSILFGCMLTLSLVNAENYSIRVESGSMQLLYDERTFPVKEGFHRDITCMKTIQVLSGEGTLTVQEDKKTIRTLTKDDEYYSLPAHKCEGLLESIIEGKNKLVRTIFSTNEVISYGVTKGTGVNTKITKDLSVSSLDKNIMLYSQEWGGYDFRLEIIRADKVIKTNMFTDKTVDYQYFIIPTKLLKDGDSYRVISGVGKEEWKKETVSQSGKITFTK